MDRRQFLSGAAGLAGGALGSSDATAEGGSTRAPIKAPAQQASIGQAGRDFPKVGGNLANQNYSILRGINRDNVNRLGGAWHINLEGGDTSQGQQSTIVAQNGVLYVQTSQQNVFAVDGRTGAIKWKTNVGKQPTNMRGVAVAEGLVFSTSGDRFVYALNQETGQPVWKTQLLTEAEEGAALVRERDNDDLFLGLRGAALAGAIVYWAGLIYVGMQGSTNGARGRAYALDAKTGGLVWRFWGDSGARRIRKRNVGRRLVENRGCRPLDPPLDRSRPRARLLVLRRSVSSHEWIDPRRNEPLLQLSPRLRRQDRTTALALPIGAS
jgi:hypothetical protein